MNSRYYLTFKSTFWSEKPKKLDKTSFNVKIFEWDYLHLTALTKESYFSNDCFFLSEQGKAILGKSPNSFIKTLNLRRVRLLFTRSTIYPVAFCWSGLHLHFLYLILHRLRTISTGFRKLKDQKMETVFIILIIFLILLYIVCFCGSWCKSESKVIRGEYIVENLKLIRRCHKSCKKLIRRGKNYVFIFQ